MAAQSNVVFGGEHHPARIGTAPLSESGSAVSTTTCPLDVDIQGIHAYAEDDRGAESGEKNGSCSCQQNDAHAGASDKTSSAPFPPALSKQGPNLQNGKDTPNEAKVAEPRLSKDQKILTKADARTNGSSEDETPSSPLGDHGNIIKDTMTFKTFMAGMTGYSGTSHGWTSQSLFAVKRLPLGGMISIPMPMDLGSSDPYELDSIHDVNFWLDRVGQEDTSQDVSSNQKQEACRNWAEIWWKHWCDDQAAWWKPRLFLVSDGHCEVRGKEWSEEDVIKTSEKGTVQLWISGHRPGRRVSPAKLSAEVHILLNSGVDTCTMYELCDECDECHNYTHRMLAWGATTQHMGELIKTPPSLLGVFYNIRSFRVGGKGGLKFEDIDGSHKRYKGRFPVTSSTKDDWFYESRTLIMAAPVHREDLLKMVLVMRDHEVVFDEEINALDLTPDRLFMSILDKYYTEWEQDWTECLDRIDASVKITLEDLSDEKRLNTFMFDGPNFERSRSYFSALQLLRIFSDYIKETRKDLQSAANRIEYWRPMGIHDFQQILGSLEDREGQLLGRIDRKIEEIKTLRDGLFNSTSVREATRATEMNRYVIVFTVVTVIYTPPSYISASFATPLPYFAKGDPGEFKQAVAIATGTTVLAALILLALANSFDDIFSNPRVSLSQTLVPLGRRCQNLWANATVKRQLRSIRETPRYLRKAMFAALERSKRPRGHDPEKLQPEAHMDLRQSEAADRTPNPNRVQFSPEDQHQGVRNEQLQDERG